MKKLIFTLTISVISQLLFAQQRSEENCITCDNNTVEVRNGASALGTQNISTGINSFAVGRENQALGDYSIAMPLVAKAIGQRSVAIGYLSNANANQSIALGSYSHTKSNATLSIAIGSYVSTQNNHSFVMGFGSADTLKNNIEKSLMIGFNSNLPTLFVSPSSGSGKTGKISIGNITNPQAKLHILSDEGEAAELKLEHRTTGINQIARIYLGSHRIEASSNSNMNFYTTNSSQHYNFYNGTIRSEQGTAAAPAYSFRLSTNTGMFRPSANTLAFSTGGQERVRIDPNGNVGIGTTNPGDYKLAVAGSGSFSDVLSVTGTGNSSIAGNLGIGVTAPSEKLDVTGWAKTSSGYKVGTSTVINSNRDYTGSNGSFTGALSVTGTGNSSFSGNVGIGTTTPDKKLVVDGDIKFTGDLYHGNELFNSSNWTVSSSNIYRANGNVGIGISNPSSKLHISSNTGNTTESFLSIENNGQPGSGITTIGKQVGGGPVIIQQAGSTAFNNQGSTLSIFQKSANGNTGFGISTYTTKYGTVNYVDIFAPASNCYLRAEDTLILQARNGSVRLETNNGYILMNANGQLGIGTQTHIDNNFTKLTVAGRIHAQEVKVTVDAGADFVFDNGYPLPCIVEVENFILANKHLPGIPSAEEMQQNGLDLGEMQIKLLQKIEELTLYVVELNKRINELEFENSSE